MLYFAAFGCTKTTEKWTGIFRTAETLQFKETAQRLGISPQVVTRTIGELERELGETLFQRSTRQVRLSDFGEQFLPQAQQLLHDSEHG